MVLISLILKESEYKILNIRGLGAKNRVPTIDLFFNLVHSY